MNSTFEIELKSLLGDKAAADRLLQTLHTLDPNLKLTEESSQLNHYFLGQDVPRLAQLVKKHLSSTKQTELQHMVDHGRNFSVRTRLLNDTVILVVKAAIDDTTSSNGIQRREFEAEMPELTLEQLDQLILEAGFKYQAKWSRQRRSFALTTRPRPVTVSIDKNAGYGYLAELETVVTDSAEAEAATTDLRTLMTELAIEELPQDRLERMFTHYNEHWPDYYGTEKVFTIQ